MMKPYQRILASFAVSALVLLLLGCSGSTGDPHPSPVPGNPPTTTASTEPPAIDSGASPELEQLNATITFWQGRTEVDSADFVALNKLAAAHLRRARLSGDVADYAAAQTALERSIEVLPGDNYSAYAQLAFVANSQHRFADGAELAQAAIELDPGEAYAYGVLGDSQLALGQYDDAAASYATMAAITPGLAVGARLAHLAELRGDVDGAIATWEAAIRQDSGERPEDTAWAYSQLGLLLQTNGRFAEALAANDAALDVLPDYLPAQAARADALAAMGELDEAASIYSTVIDRRPKPEYAIALGDIYMALGDERQARLHYGLVAAIDQLYKANGIVTDLAMANFFAGPGDDPAEALRQAESAYAERQTYQTADALAWARFRNRDFEGADALARQATALGVREAPLYYHAGAIALALGEPERAAGLLSTALEINPRFSLVYAPDAEDLLAKAGARVERN